MRKILYILYRPYKWLVMVPVAGISAVFFGFLAAISAILVGPRFGS